MNLEVKNVKKKTNCINVQNMIPLQNKEPFQKQSFLINFLFKSLMLFKNNDLENFMQLFMQEFHVDIQHKIQLRIRNSQNVRYKVKL